MSAGFAIRHRPLWRVCCSDSADMYTSPGIITKPDTLAPGSDNEASFACLARNEEVEFRLGWHILKNMDSDQVVSTLTKRDEDEKAFFSEGIWQQLPEYLLGISELRRRLSKVLLQQIAAELPNVIREIETKTGACHERLSKLGQPRSTEKEQGIYLMQMSQRFQTLVKASVDGTYNDPFFENAKTERGYQQRIRAVIQTANRDLATELTEKGHYREICLSPPNKDGKKGAGIPRKITRKAHIKHVEALMVRSRGCELPGNFNPIIITHLFHEQSRPWAAILQRHVTKVWNAVREFLTLVVTHIADETAIETINQEIAVPALDKLLKGLNAKSVELLKPHNTGHPITYNRDFIEALQGVQEVRRRGKIIDILEETLGVTFDAEDPEISFDGDQNINLEQLIDEIVMCDELNVDSQTASNALDYMEAYYKVSRTDIHFILY